MHSVTYKRRDYLFAVRRRRVDDLQRWVLCLRSPRTHEWLPILGERPFVGHAEAEARLARLAKDNKWEVAYAYGIEFAPPENSKKGWRGCGPAVLRPVRRLHGKNKTT